MIDIVIKYVEEILGGEEKNKKLELLSWLWDCFESYVTIDNIMIVINLLIKYAIVENDIEVREAILDTIQIAIRNRKIKECEFSLLEKNIELFPENMVLIIIGIFELTYDKAYISILENLCNNDSVKIATSAKEALLEIK